MPKKIINEGLHTHDIIKKTIQGKRERIQCVAQLLQEGKKFDDIEKHFQNDLSNELIDIIL